MFLGEKSDEDKEQHLNSFITLYCWENSLVKKFLLGHVSTWILQYFLMEINNYYY